MANADFRRVGRPVAQAREALRRRIAAAARRACLWPLAFVALSLALAGCASRPGPEALNDVAAAAPGAKIATIYVATTRERVSPDVNVFNAGRAAEMSYAEFVISIPPNHKPGNIEWPGPTPDPSSAFIVVSQRVLDRQAFEAEISRKRDGRPPNVGVFVHGYNVNFQEAVFQMAQMTADANVDGVPIVFAWPSEGRPAGYVADKDAATFSRDQLAALLTTLARRPGFGQVHVIGHSMGGWLTMEALRQLRLTHQDATIRRLRVVLAAPDIDVDVFREQLAVIGPLSPPMTVLVARDDGALSLSRLVADEHDRVGAADVRDPRIAEAARKANLQVVDISSLETTDMFKHDRFVQLAAVYPKLSAEAASGQGGLRQAGAFVFNAVGATVSTPFTFVGSVVAGE
jgi:esterase/lipase superfamily enzyme